MAAAGATVFVVGLGGAAQAATFFESGDAGQLLNTGQVVGSGFDKIAGNLSNTFDVDLYKIELPDGLFSATTVGGSNFDTQLFLFNSSGLGIVFNDDVIGFKAPSTIQATLSAGAYYLGISGWNIAPVSSSGLIFPLNDSVSNNVYNALNGPTGPGGSQPLNGWVPSVTDQNGGDYQITLSTSVPEPSSLAGWILASGLGLFGCVRRRFQAKNNLKSALKAGAIR